MQAFGLEESGHYEAAEDAGQAAIAVNGRRRVGHPRRDPHLRDAGTGRHRGRLPHRREADWGSGNLFTVHNWWHLALFQLELGDPAAALAIYDREIHHDGTDGTMLNLVDASAMLWRLISTGSTPAPASPSWPTPGPPPSTTARGTPSTTCTPRWPTSVPGGWTRPIAWSTGSAPI
jgi:hypothetical protein